MRKVTSTVIAWVTLSAATALAATPAATSLNNCENAVKVATAAFVKNKVAAIGGCLQAVSTQLVKKDAVDAAAAAATCVAQFRKINDSRGIKKQLSDKLAAAIVLKCDPNYQTPKGQFPNTHTLADIIGPGAGVARPLNAANLNVWCSAYGGDGSIDTLQEWIDCLANASECAVDSTIAAQYPRAIEWLNLVKPSMQALSSPASDPSKVSDAVAGLAAVKAAIDGPDNDNIVSIRCGCGQVAAPTPTPTPTPSPTPTNTSANQNGATAGEQGQVATSVTQLTTGGGVGGVGGEGLGGAVDGSTLALLMGSPTADASLEFLYPYDKTVWPRGLLAPLLQWDWTTGDADAILIRLSTTSASFNWSGTFARPAILTQTGGKFIRHPIPQDVWDNATNAAGGADKLTVSLTVARGGTAYGPITETWTVSPGRLSGIIYYDARGTQMVLNSTGAVGGNGQFGSAVLSLRAGDTAPQLAAGANGGVTACRSCHSAAALGSAFVAQHGDGTYTTSSDYLVSPGSINEFVMATGAAFPGVVPDGSLMLTPGAQLFTLPNTLPHAVSGLSGITTTLGTSAFSPGGTLVAFSPMAGPIANPTQKLGVMAFNQGSGTFSGFVPVVDDTGQPAATRPGWPAFLPTGTSLVFHHQSAAGGDGNSVGDLRTEAGAKSQVHWTTANAANVNALNQLNGKDAGGTVYLPKLATPIVLTCNSAVGQVGNINPDHGDDVDLNYEPTVNPLGSGGYAWVAFTSRRMYGSVANIPPYCSDPRGVDLVQHITPKKLWVAAVDLNAAPGSDASHPAFYLPAQELLAGNGHPAWVLEPCRNDGASCATGDQCCNGFCAANVCASAPGGFCSNIGDKCTSAADCCDAVAACIDGFCAQSAPM